MLITTASLIILFSLPAAARIQSSPEDVNLGNGSISIFEQTPDNSIGLTNETLKLFGVDIESYLGSAQEFFVDKVTDLIGIDSLGEHSIYSVLTKTTLRQIASKISDLFGGFGYPNPTKIDREIPEIIVNDTTEEVEEFTPFGKKQLAISTSKRQITSAYIESRLGEEAQEKKKQQLEGISKLANNSAAVATNVVKQNVTQDVLKEIATQNANEAYISQAIHAELAQVGMNQNVAVAELSNISETMEKQEWKKTVDSAAARVSFVDTVTQFSSLFQ